MQVFKEIVGLKHRRVQAICPTQYGKSLVVALALVVTATVKHEQFTILAPSEKKARIIMDYVIKHLFDNYLFYSQLELDESISLDRLRRERSKNRLDFKRGGGIQILTLDARNAKRNIEAAMGFGGNRLILDESSLIPDQLYSTVKRMLGGYKYDNTFLFEIGNPFYRNHFLRTWRSDRYHKIFIDYKQGMAEGRYSEEFIQEMRDEAFFDVFYECKFPEEDDIDSRGYRYLITETQLKDAIADGELDGELRLGVDIGRGGDKSVYVLRGSKLACKVSENKSADLMTQVNEIERIINEYGVKDNMVFIDDTGVGSGVTDRLREKGVKVNGVKVGGKAQNDKFKNIKAEISWEARKWVLGGGKLRPNDAWWEIGLIKYKEDTSSKLKIEPKEDLMRQGKSSPDTADAFFLTFVPPPPKPRIRTF